MARQTRAKNSAAKVGRGDRPSHKAKRLRHFSRAFAKKRRRVLRSNGFAYFRAWELAWIDAKGAAWTA